MRAIGLHEYGGPEVLVPVELPDPHAGPGQVRIRVEAAAVNPVDTMLRTGLLAAADGPPPPYVPGLEVAGTVDEVGADVPFSVGDEVVGFVDNAGAHGGYSDLVVLTAASVAPRPARLTSFEAASFLNNALTARNALDVLALPAGSTLLVTGAAGAVGGYAVQLGAADGLRVVAVVAEADEALVRGYGAAEVVARGDDVAARVLAAVGPVDAVVDAAVLEGEVAPAVRDGGQMGVLRGWSGDPGRDITVHALNVRSRAQDSAAITRLSEQVADGALAVRVAAVLPARQAPQAHRRMDAGGLRGRVVLALPVDPDD